MAYLVVGLGNPGSQYSHTRHNAGFMVLDEVAKRVGAEWKNWQKLGDYAKVSVGGKEVFLLKPTTYMNNSGQATGSLARFYKIKPQDCLICFDEISLAVGKLRLRKNGSAGGQNGMKSVIAHLGTQDIPRLRVGTGPKPEKFDLADFVLSNFTKAETPLLEESISKAADAVETFLTKGMEIAMNRFN